MSSAKPKLAIYWAAACGGCEIALVNLHADFLQLAETFEICFCPCLLDSKKNDLFALPDNGIDFTLFNGAIRTDENVEMAHLLRQKSRVLIAFGACAASGGIPALSNLGGRIDHLATVYFDNPTIDNPHMSVPQSRTETEHGPLHLPDFHATVKSLAQVVAVDYVISGCPPESQSPLAILQTLLASSPPPVAVDRTLDGAARMLCDDCRRTREEKRIARFYRTWEIEPDGERCLLEQGLLCHGVATRQGCGALCPQVNVPCSGCYGPLPGVGDQGAALVAALSGAIDITPFKGLDGAQLSGAIQRLLDTLPDQPGSFYRYTLSQSLLARVKG